MNNLKHALQSLAGCSASSASSLQQASLAWQGRAEHSTAWHITAQHSTAQHRAAQHSTARHSTVQFVGHTADCSLPIVPLSSMVQWMSLHSVMWPSTWLVTLRLQSDDSFGIWLLSASVATAKCLQLQFEHLDSQMLVVQSYHSDEQALKSVACSRVCF